MLQNSAKKFLLVVLLNLFILSCYAFAQNSAVTVSGTIIDRSTRERIPAAVIQVLPADTTEDFSRNIGFAANENGEFLHNMMYKFPLRLRVSHISYQSKDILVRNLVEGKGLKIYLDAKVFDSDELIVLAEIATRDELESPSNIYKVGSVDVQQLASFDVFDLVSTVREVDVSTQSMTMQSVNTRGFASTANKRFLQLTDGVDNRAPGLSFPVGNLMGLIDLDISSVEIMPGPSSAKYGSNAINGVMVMNSRDPFLNEGLSFEAKAGVTQLDVGGSNFFSAEGEGIYDIQGRYAKAITNNLAFKLTGSYMTGQDWEANNYDNIGFGLRGETHPDQPGYNGVNVYGDEGFVLQNLYSSEDGFTYTGPPVTRTGYRETNLVDYDVSTTRLSGALHYKFNEDYRIIVDTRYGITNSLYTGDSRIRLVDFSMFQTSVDFQLNKLKIKGYTTLQSSGNSYDVNSLANILIQNAKSDEDWYRDYRIAVTQGISFAGIPANSPLDARRFADNGTTLLQGRTAVPRFAPGTDEFNTQLNNIINSTDPESGAAFIDNSKSYDVQATYEMPDLIDNSVLTIGSNFRFFELDSEGTIFADGNGNMITNYEYGFFLSSESSLIDDNLKVNSSLRFDKNENFDVRVSPQLAFNYNVNNEHYFKFSYQYGFRYPGVREQFMDNDLGSARLIGGIPEIADKYELQENSIFQNSVDDFITALGDDNTIQNRLDNLSILEAGIVANNQLRGIKPELVNTFEIGYKRLFTPSLFLDINSYVSLYKNFIGITRVVKTSTSPSVDLLVTSGQIGTALENDRLFIFSNSEGQLIVQGASFNVEYNSGGFMSSLNGTIAKLLQESNDPITPGFNTPPFKLNFEWGHRYIIPNVGFKMVYRLRTGYFWESSFIDGPIETYGHFDFQFNIRMRKTKGALKIGVTNLGVRSYTNIYGGPSIGSFIFATYSFNSKSL